MKFVSVKDGIDILSTITSRVPKVEENIIVDNEYLRDPNFIKPRRYDNLYSFALNRTVVNNDSNKKKIINKAIFNVEKIEKYFYEEIVINYGLDDQKFIMYALNNGNICKAKKKIDINLFAFIDGGKKEKINSYSREMGLSSGEIERIFEKDLTLDLRDLFIKNKNYNGLIFTIVEEYKSTDLIMCYFEREQNKFYYGGMGGGGPKAKINLIEIDLNNYRKQYVFNTLNFELPAQESKSIDIYIVPNESCKLDYSIEYFCNDKKIKNYEKCRESTIIKVPQFKFNPNSSIQFDGYVFKFLVDNNIKKYKKGSISYVDDCIGSNAEEVKNSFEILIKGNPKI